MTSQPTVISSLQVTDLREIRNARIRAEYVKQTALKKYKSAFIVAQLSAAYYLKEATIWAIVSQTGRYKTD